MHCSFSDPIRVGFGGFHDLPLPVPQSILLDRRKGSLYTGPMKKFNTTGPCDPARHYMVPAAERLPEVATLVEDQLYFVVHAPRQTGKTTTLQALSQEITAKGKVAMLHFTCEAGQAAGDDVAMAEGIVLESIRHRATIHLPVDCQPPETWPEAAPGARLVVGLSAWAKKCPRPLALVFDEIDALLGDSLMTVLRQLRGGFPDRPTAFPSSVILCGMRDVRDYKTASGGDVTRLGTASPFNVKVESLKLVSFTRQQVFDLCLQHTSESGQEFEGDALNAAYDLTKGQPWLVNALAREVIEKIKVHRSQPITAAHMETAKERLILARATHLDSLVARLNEPRVRRIMAPLIAGSLVTEVDNYNDDVLYLRDLGLVGPEKPLQVANPIYREVIVRVLAHFVEDQISTDPRSFVLPDGRLDMNRLFQEFLVFWKEHGEILTGSMPYHEVAPQLVLMAFLQRVVNGGGYVEREYGVGRGRIDLLVKWPCFAKATQGRPSGKGTECPHKPRPCFAEATQGRSSGRGSNWQREAVELKVWADRKPDPLDQGLKQLDEYLTRLSLDSGFLVLFDRRTDALPMEERAAIESAVTPTGKPVVVVRG